MSSATKAKTLTKQLKTGIWKVKIDDAWLSKNPDGSIQKSTKGEIGLVIRFMETNSNAIYEQIYWLKGDREKAFKQMAAKAGIDLSNHKFKEAAKGKLVWIWIKECYDIYQDKYILDEFDEKIVNYYIFKYSSYMSDESKPSAMGNPQTDKDGASGDFIDYRHITATEQSIIKGQVAVVNNSSTIKSNHSFLEEKPVLQPQKISDDWDI